MFRAFIVAGIAMLAMSGTARADQPASFSRIFAEAIVNTTIAPTGGFFYDDAGDPINGVGVAFSTRFESRNPVTLSGRYGRSEDRQTDLRLELKFQF